MFGLKQFLRQSARPTTIDRDWAINSGRARVCVVLLVVLRSVVVVFAFGDITFIRFTLFLWRCEMFSSDDSDRVVWTGRGVTDRSV